MKKDCVKAASFSLKPIFFIPMINFFNVYLVVDKFPMLTMQMLWSLRFFVLINEFEVFRI